MVTEPVTPAADVMALVPTALTEDQVTSLILREEAALARQVTDLAGERTQAFYVEDPASSGLYIDAVSLAGYSSIWILSTPTGPLGLQRPTDAVEVVDGGVALDPSEVRLLRQGTLVERVSGAWRGPVVEVTYTPNDLLEVQRVVIELCRITLTETGYNAESIGDYSYTKKPAVPGTPDPRKALIRSLMTHLPLGTTRVRSSSEDDRISGSAR
jgi:hypothetical protein